MANYFIDQSSATNGDGSSSNPFNTIAGTLSSGNTYWLRRTSEASNVSTYTSTGVSIPSNIQLIGWPMPGDRHYDLRPSLPAWDADTEEYATLLHSGPNNIGKHELLVIKNTINVELHRLLLIMSTACSYNQISPAIELTNASDIRLEDVYILLRSNAEGNRGMYIISSDGLWAERVVIENNSNFTISNNSTLSDLLEIDIINASMLEILFSYGGITGYVIDATADHGRCVDINSANDTLFRFTYGKPGERMYERPLDRVIYFRGEDSYNYSLELDTSNITYGDILPNLVIDRAIDHDTSGGEIWLKGPTVGRISFGDNRRMLVKADAILTEPEYGSSAVNLFRSARALIEPYTLGESVAMESPTGLDISISEAGQLHVTKAAKDLNISISSNTTRGCVSYIREDGVYRCISLSGSVISSGVLREDGGFYSYLFTSNKDTLERPGPIWSNTDLYTPISLDVVPGSHVVTLSGAGGIGLNGHIRPGDLTVYANWVDSTGLHQTVVADIDYDVTDIWNNISNYIPFQIHVPVVTEINTTIYFTLVASFSKTVYPAIFVDNLLTIS